MSEYDFCTCHFENINCDHCREREQLRLGTGKVHELKCTSHSFDAICRDQKTFEYRYNDRGYRLGDTLHLREYDGVIKEYSGYEIKVKVNYILHGGQYGIPEGYVIMSIVRI